MVVRNRYCLICDISWNDGNSMILALACIVIMMRMSMIRVIPMVSVVFVMGMITVHRVSYIDWGNGSCPISWMNVILG